MTGVRWGPNLRGLNHVDTACACVYGVGAQGLQFQLHIGIDTVRPGVLVFQQIRSGQPGQLHGLRVHADSDRLCCANSH